MRRLIWGFAGRTYHIVGNLMHWLIWLILDYTPIEDHSTILYWNQLLDRRYCTGLLCHSDSLTYQAASPLPLTCLWAPSGKPPRRIPQGSGWCHEPSSKNRRKYKLNINTEKNMKISTTVQSLYNTPRYNTDMDITQSCCGSNFFLPWNFTKE